MAEGCNSKCGICLSFIFTEPKLLHCYHTFCLPCLQKLDMNGNKITCPLCKTKMSLSDKGVVGLKSYPFRLEYVKVDNAVMDACDLCDEQNFAVSKCLECKINLCSNCRNYHGKLKASKNHTIQPLKIFDSEELDQTISNVKTKCKEHCKELTLFCKQCNTSLCIECLEETHHCHQVENLSMFLQTKKEMLLVRIASLKARISFLQNTAEMVKLKEINYNKHCHTETGCKNIIDNIKKKDMKEFDKYMNQIETEKMSLSGLIMTTDDYINQSSDAHFLAEFSVIRKRLDNTSCKSVNIFPPIHDLGYEWDAVSEAVIEKMFGKIIAREKEKEVKPIYPHLPVPQLCLLPAHKAVKLSEFVVPNEVLDIIPADNDNAWLLTPRLACMYTNKGIKDQSFNTHDDIKRFVRKTASRMLFCKDVVVFTDKNFIVLDSFQKLYAQFKALATDKYGNILVADYFSDIIYLLSENGVFQQSLVNKSYGVHETTIMIIDECGYLWLVGASKCIKVFSYQ
ncbi:unnamed protein product [Mytilus coruscus]|uniref:TRIM56 n=1 Tax=Mytilus coruscus TaxID=42192 RepID=A0A6J8A4H0_MYTCO|nr:unnamed protein product [Mytilus coruscus]